MRERIEFSVAEVQPDQGAVLRSQGLPEGPELPARVRDLLDAALELHASLAEPRGVFERLPIDDFAELYAGAGNNAADSPVPRILPGADALALYAATLGEPAPARIKELFHDKDLALGYMLDGVASVATDHMSTLLARRFGDALGVSLANTEALKVLPYSPGYCGWHVSGQGRLFARLRPGEIGITLNESFLMTPIKSVSGVLIAGPGEIHRFRPEYPFCDECKTHACRERIAWAVK